MVGLPVPWLGNIKDITWNSSHLVDHIPNGWYTIHGWVMWKMGTSVMTQVYNGWFIMENPQVTRFFSEKKLKLLPVKVFWIWQEKNVSNDRIIEYFTGGVWVNTFCIAIVSLFGLVKQILPCLLLNHVSWDIHIHSIYV